MPLWIYNILSPVNRWLHIVASTVLVGGVLFFEFVVPLATEDLIEEQRLAVFGRARWVFRPVVWLSALILIGTGLFSAWRMWHIYRADEAMLSTKWYASRPWMYAHTVLGVLGFWMALVATRTRRLAHRPVGLLRALLVVLLVCIFLASVARHVRLRLRDFRENGSGAVERHMD